MPSNTFVAVRTTGEFLWPPDQHGSTTTKKGAVSIEYGPDPTSADPARKLATLRWDPLVADGSAFAHRFDQLPQDYYFYGGQIYEQYCPTSGSTPSNITPQIAHRICLVDNAGTRSVPTLRATTASLTLQCRVPQLTATEEFPENTANRPHTSPALQPRLSLATLKANLKQLPDFQSNHGHVNQIKALMSMIGEAHSLNGTQYRVSFGPSGIRHTFSYLDAQGLTGNGVLRSHNTGFYTSLLVALEGANLARITSYNRYFTLVATVRWQIDFENDLWEADSGNLKAIPTEIVPEVAWNPVPSTDSFDYTYTPHGILRDAYAATNLARSGMAPTAGGLLDSALPNCMGVNTASDANDFFAVRFSTIVGEKVPGGLTEKKLLATDNVQALCISLLSPFRQGAPRSSITFDATFPLLDLTYRQSSPTSQGSPKYRLQLQHATPDGPLTENGHRILMFLAVAEDPQNRSVLEARVGGLTFSRTSPGLLLEKEEKSSSFLTIALPPNETLSNLNPPRLIVDWDLSLAIDRVVPVRGDQAWSDREHRRFPLLVDHTINGSGSGSRQFILRVHETISPRDDRQLRCDLAENSPDANTTPESYTLLSRHPWGVLKFTRERLTRVGDEGTAIIATYDSDRRTWLHKLMTPEYRLQFPPQGIGESADKPRLLELHDINASPRAGDVQLDNGEVVYVRPAPGDSVDDFPRRSYVVESRLTPSLDLWIRPADRLRNYVLAEWNAYELFRQRGEFGLGVALRALRGEFLYGLTVGIDPSREPSPSLLARVAEVEALAGKMPLVKYLTQHLGVAEDLLNRWRLVRNALLARHERLEVWSPAYDQPRPFAPARFSAGATFALRKTALHRCPALPLDEFEFQPSTEGQIRIAQDRGLSGGAIWPIESQAFWEALRAEPASQGGSIERIAIGPTGGDADQSASFLKGLLTIASSTRAGFVQRQRVEILGRIGVYWNRAKHVVIYERTVNLSEQFAPEPDGDDWYLSRSRRAVIRKVQEYIEILEPVRSYPDDPELSATEVAFLDSVRFQKIIFVDSAWGREIKDPQTGARGYVIPLWNLNAARKRPNVYQFPNVSFVTVGEGKTEDQPFAPRQCANPDNLYFYAQASPLEGDTNLWKPVFDVDYGYLYNPQDLEEQLAVGGSGYGSPLGPTDVPTGRKPSPPRVLPGHHRFTWRLLPDSGRTKLNAAHGNKPVYGNVESITFSRGGMTNENALPEMSAHFKHAAAISTLSLGPAIISQHLAELMLMKDEFGAQTEVTARQRQIIDNILAEFTNASAATDAALLDIGDLANSNPDISNAILRAAGLGDNPLNCNELKTRLAGDIRRKLLQVAHVINDQQDLLFEKIDAWSEAQLHAAWDAIDAAIKDPKERVTQALSELLVASAKLSNLLGDAQTEVDRVLGEMEAATRVLHDAFADVDVVLARGARRAQDCLAACSADVEWTAGRYRKLREQFREDFNGLALELNSVVADCCQRIGAELGTFGWKLGQVTVEQFAKRVATIINGLKLSITITLNALDPSPAITQCLDRIQEARGALAEWEAEIRGDLASADNLFRDQVATLEAGARDVTQKVLSSAAVVPALLADVSIDLLEHIDETYTLGRTLSQAKLDELKKRLFQTLPRLGQIITNNETLDQVQAAVLSGLQDLCDALREHFDDFAFVPTELKSKVEGCLGTLKDKYDALRDAADDVATIVGAVNDLHGELDSVRDNWVNSVATAQAYSTRVMEGFSKLASSSAKSAPSNVLKLMAAATAAPEIAQLQANVDRVRCTYEEAKVNISKIRATLSKLGDALKALGIDIPTDGLSENFEIPEGIIQNYDIRQLFPNFGGLDLSRLLPDVKVPKGVKDAVKISHDFDRKQFRAWVQVDVNVPVEGRKELYSFGPFAVYFRDTTLIGKLRAEASKDTEETKTTANSKIATHIDIDVGGTRILSLEDTSIRYAQGEGLKFDFDPKKIRLHAALQFVQDTLGDIVGDEIGGLQIIKDHRGIPIGVEHVFSLPNISLMAGTSGVSNIQLSNQFQLLAYPEFVLTNRFNLSRPEQPFLFSFFIVGGTGFIVIDATYRPLDGSLTVGVEVGMGGSASLGFSFGPVSGQVYITFSLVITYQKRIGPGGASGDGLSVGLLLVIAGRVSLWGIVDIFLVLMLRMTYQENGAVDGVGSLSVSVKICRFITLRFGTTVTYRLKNGRSQSTVSSSASVEEGERIKELKDKANRLQKARA